MTTSALEITANLVNAGAIVLAGRNSVHTWWVGIVGCSLFGVLFFLNQLYADSTLQVFFIATSVAGWMAWTGTGQEAVQVSRVRPLSLLWMVVAALLAAAAYAGILHRHTNAYAPLADSLVLTFSVLSQLLLMRRRLETWWGWLIVNTIAVPLFWSRGLHVTSILYAGFWINALVSLRHWRRLLNR